MPKTKTYSQIAIEEYLKGENFSIVATDNPGYIAMESNIVTNGITFKVLVNIPILTPPAYPTFHLIDTDYVFRQPHIERPHKQADGSMQCRLCIRKSAEKTFNANPAELFHALYNDFLRLLKSLSEDSFESKHELFAEFDSYWANDFTVLWHMKDDPDDKSFINQVVFFRDGNIKEQFSVITNDVDGIKQFAQAAKYKFKTQQALYLDINTDLELPLPYTYNDFYNLLKQHGYEQFIKHESKSTRDTPLLIFSFILPNGLKHKAVIFLPAQAPIKKGKKIQMTSRLKVFLTPFMNHNRMIGAHIKSIEQSHLFKRGGNIMNQKTSQMHKKIAIVGCGSIGSTLAYKLCKSGISDMTLIDPERLSTDNIGRHLLGMADINQYKAEGVAKYLRGQFIDMHVVAINEGAEDVLDAIANVDLLITAIGSDAPSVEPWLAEKVKNGELPPMVTCWLEADAIAAHAIVIDDQSTFDLEDIIESISILENTYSVSLIQSEVGCNSNYMTYGYLDADIHINRIAKFIIHYLHEENVRGITSIGNIGIHKEHLKYNILEGSEEYINEKVFKA
jgi:hypothetical protein